MAAAAAFVWLNAILVRSFHHYAGVPYRFDAWVELARGADRNHPALDGDRPGDMWAASRARARGAWFSGAALLARGGAEARPRRSLRQRTVTRIVSFIGVGVLMLVIGYVAPLPAKEIRHAAP